jgi:hypothetical protein
MRDAVGLLALDEPKGAIAGSAFAISAELAVTAFHCVRGENEKPTTRKLWLRLEPGLALRACVERFDPDADLALLRIAEPLPDGWRPLPVAAPGPAMEERRLWLEGFPEDWPYKDQPMRLGGVLRKAAASDLGGSIPTLGIYSEEVAAGRDPSGCSGGPVRIRLRLREENGWRTGWVAVGAVRYAQPEEPESERMGRGGQVFATPLAGKWAELGDLLADNEPIDADAGGGVASRTLPFGPPPAAASGCGARDQVLGRIRRAALDNECAYVHVEGAAGLGKTALAAHFARAEDVPAFFVDARVGTTRPDQCLDHLAAELILRHGLQRDRLPEDSGRSSVQFSAILREATEEHKGPVWLVIDALDEADATAPEANPILLPPRLPPGAFVLLTSRNPPSELMTEDDTPVVSLRFDAGGEEQRNDLRQYVEQRLGSDAELGSAIGRIRPAIETADAVERLVAASEGNFQYVKYVLGDLRQHRDSAASLDFDDLPRKLRGYYEVRFWRPMSALIETEPEAWATLYRPVLEQLAVAAEAVTASWIAAGTAASEADVSQRVLARWRRFLRVDRRDGADTWRIVHGSFADFLGEHLDLEGAHAAVADRLLAEPAGDDGYASRHLFTHMRRAGRTDALLALAAKPSWQFAQLEADPAGDLYLNDLDQAWLAIEARNRAAIEAGEPPPDLGRELWCALATASILTATQTVPPALVPVLVETELWSLERACATARRAPDPDHRARALGELSRWDHSLLDEALAAAAEIGHPTDRAELTAALAADLPGERRRQIFGDLLAESIEMDPWHGAYAILKLIPHLDADQLQATVAATRAVDLDIERGLLFIALAPFVGSVATEPGALEAVRELGLPDGLLPALAASPPAPAQADAVLSAAGGEGPDFYRGRRKTEWLLTALRPLASTGYLQRAATLASANGSPDEFVVQPLAAALADRGCHRAALDLIEQLARRQPRAEAIGAVAASLPDDLVRRAYELARETESATALASLIPRLPAGERRAAASEAVPKTDFDDDAERMMALGNLRGSLTPLQADEALDGSRAIAADWRLEEVLAALAQVASTDGLEAAWNLTNRLNDRRRDPLAATILRRLPDDLFARERLMMPSGPRTMAAIGERIDRESAGSIVRRLRTSNDFTVRFKLCLAAALDEADATYAMESLPPVEAERFMALRMLQGSPESGAPELEEPLEADPTLGFEESIVCDLLAPALLRAGRGRDAIGAVRRVSSTALRVETLARLAPHLDQAALELALEAAGAIESWSQRIELEGILADRLDAEQLPQRCRLLHDDVEASVARLGAEYRDVAREQCHASILPLEAQLSKETWEPTLARLRPRLEDAAPPDDWHLLVATTWAAALRPSGPDLLPAEPGAVLLRAWSRLLRRAATLKRGDAIKALESTLICLPAIGGTAAGRDAAEAILEVGRRWS